VLPCLVAPKEWGPGVGVFSSQGDRTRHFLTSNRCLTTWLYSIWLAHEKLVQTGTQPASLETMRCRARMVVMLRMVVRVDIMIMTIIGIVWMALRISRIFNKESPSP
jgi:hypothetical protein